MRGYNIDPTLLLGAFSHRKEKSQTPPNDKESTPEKQDDKQVQPPKESVRLIAQPAINVPQQRISPTMALTVAGILTLILLVIVILDARSRITRLESMLFSLLAQKQ